MTWFVYSRDPITVNCSLVHRWYSGYHHPGLQRVCQYSVAQAFNSEPQGRNKFVRYMQIAIQYPMALDWHELYSIPQNYFKCLRHLNNMRAAEAQHFFFPKFYIYAHNALFEGYNLCKKKSPV